MRGPRGFKRPSDTWDAAPEAWSPWAAASSDFVPAMPSLATCRVSDSEADHVCAPERRCCRSRRAWLSNRWPRCLRRAHDRESRRESDLDDGLTVIWFIALADGPRRLLPGNSVASTGKSNWFERQLATKKSRSPRHRVRRLREPSFPAPFDRISDPQIPLTKQLKGA
jgi:hypothetical protein